jgi:hypothetical protein
MQSQPREPHDPHHHSAMVNTIEFYGRGPITYKSAVGEDYNVIHQLRYLPASEKFDQEMWDQRGKIEAVTKHHLGLGGSQTCTVLDRSTWRYGSFNVCVMVLVELAKERY